MLQSSIEEVPANTESEHAAIERIVGHEEIVLVGQGDKNYFFTPHYPMNQRVFRMGVSWNFFN